MPQQSPARSSETYSPKSSNCSPPKLTCATSYATPRKSSGATSEPHANPRAQLELDRAAPMTTLPTGAGEAELPAVRRWVL